MASQRGYSGARFWRRQVDTRASDYFRQLFETDCEVFFAFNGTAANSPGFEAPRCELPARRSAGDRPRRDRRVRRAGVLLQRLQTAAAGEDRQADAAASIRDIALQGAAGCPAQELRVVTLPRCCRGSSTVRRGRVEAISATCKGTSTAHGRRALLNACAFLGCSPAELELEGQGRRCSTSAAPRTAAAVLDGRPVLQPRPPRTSTTAANRPANGLEDALPRLGRRTAGRCLAALTPITPAAARLFGQTGRRSGLMLVKPAACSSTLSEPAIEALRALALLHHR